MMKYMKKSIRLILTLYAASLIGSTGHIPDEESQLNESEIHPIRLSGEASSRNAEYSGLTWYKNWLIMLPQYPDRFDNSLFAVSKGDILQYLSSELPEPLTPIPLKLDIPKNFDRQFPGFEGFESIAFSGNQVFLTVEAEKGDEIRGYVVSGEINDDAFSIRMNRYPISIILPQTKISNFSEESILVSKESIYTIYEANGRDLNPDAKMHVISRDNNTITTIDFPNIEYRVTDATIIDDDDTFWVLNYLWPGDRKDLVTRTDPLAEQYGLGETHSKYGAVERIIQCKISRNGVILTDRPPINLKLEKGDSHNWEGIVRLDKAGFIIVTDKFPQTILAFVSYNK